MSESTRRGFLAACVTGMGALTGCAQLSDGLTEASLDHREPRRLQAPYPPIVSFDDDTQTVVVTGVMYYGSSSCDRIAIKDKSYDRKAAHLTVRIAPGRKSGLDPSEACTADMAGSHYRAEFQFADDLPTTVTVVENGAESDVTRRTVNRADQRRFCTGTHPDGSEAAARAHWTCPEKFIEANISVNGGDGT